MVAKHWEIAARGTSSGDSADARAARLSAAPACDRCDTAWRFVAFVLALPTGFAIMFKVYGAGDLQSFVLCIALPSLALLLFLAWWRGGQLRTDVVIGAVAGLIGAVGYDIVRIPAEVAGYRVFGTISVFGLWLLDAAKSSRFTELAGWSFNYVNGMSFGVLYALFMRGRHWLFGVLWAWLLEAIAVFTPFGRIFGIRGNVVVLLIAFGAHVAYGVPLGRAVQHWQDTRSGLAEMPLAVRAVVAAGSLLLLVHPLLSPSAIADDLRARPGVFRVEGLDLNPRWLRLHRGERVAVENPGRTATTVTLKQSLLTWRIAPGKAAYSPPLAPGIHQFYVETTGQTHSSFVVVEPVERGGSQ